MRCAILSIGTEILFGQIVNTNTVYLTRELNNMGFDVLYHHTVGDNAARLKSIIQETYKDCDLIVCTGGLGPTEDDLTKETIAEAFDDKLEMHQESLEVLEAFAKRRGWKEITPNNYKQAMMPTKATVFQNDVGTAPAFALLGSVRNSEDNSVYENRIIVTMPGPPREMKWMWNNKIKPYLLGFSDKALSYKIIRTFGIGESKLETVLLPLIDSQTDPTIATYAKEGESSLRIASQRPTKEEADAAVMEMIDKVSEIIGKYIYSIEDEELHQVVGNYLIENDISISVCESCTGGMFASRLVEVPGISKVFDRGLVTYSNQAKIDELGVSKEILDTYGAESPEIAKEMAEGLYRVTGSRLCISSTGVAGPGNGKGPNGEVPVGDMFIGVCFDGETYVKEMHTGRDDRVVNRNSCMLTMFDEARKTIMKYSH